MRNIVPRSLVAVQSLSPGVIGVTRFPDKGTDSRLFLLPSASPLLKAWTRHTSISTGDRLSPRSIFPRTFSRDTASASAIQASNAAARESVPNAD